MNNQKPEKLQKIGNKSKKQKNIKEISKRRQILINLTLIQKTKIKKLKKTKN